MIEPGPALPWYLRDVVRPGPLMGYAPARPHHLQVASTNARRERLPTSAVLICESNGSINPTAARRWRRGGTARSDRAVM
jgi:hypothetical protein